MKMPSLAAIFAVALLGSQAPLHAEPPETNPPKTRPAPVKAIAYRSDGKLGATGGYGEVLLFDTASRDLAGKLTGQPC